MLRAVGGLFEGGEGGLRYCCCRLLRWRGAGQGPGRPASREQPWATHMHAIIMACMQMAMPSPARLAKAEGGIDTRMTRNDSNDSNESN